MFTPRSAAEATGFPYNAQTTCYIKIDSEDGTVTTGKPTQADLDSCSAGDLQILAAWPGQWRTDLFVIDDVAACARALGLVAPGAEPHNHDMRWNYYSDPASKAATLSLNVDMLCGCNIENIHGFADQMLEQFGWTVRTSQGWSGGNRSDGITDLIIPVQRTTIDTPQVRELYLDELESQRKNRERLEAWRRDNPAY